MTRLYLILILVALSISLGIFYLGFLLGKVKGKKDVLKVDRKYNMIKNITKYKGLRRDYKNENENKKI